MMNDVSDALRARLEKAKKMYGYMPSGASKPLSAGETVQLVIAEALIELVAWQEARNPLSKESNHSDD
jgi:hypothetical protein